MPKPYVASGKSGPSGLFVVLAASLAAGVILGAVEGWVSQWFSLLIVFPVVLGAVAGAAAATTVESRKVRKPLAAALIAFAAGVAAQATVHFMEYRHARGLIAEHLDEDAEAAAFVKEHGADAAVDALLGGQESTPPFLGFLQLAARNGVTITQHGSSSGSPTLTGLGVWILWLVELLIAAGIAAYMAWEQAKAPFCEACEAWYDKGKGIAGGAGDRKGIKETRARLEAGQLGDAVRELGVSDGKTAAVLWLKGCPKDCASHEPMLELRSLAGLNTNKKQQRTVYRALISASEAQSLKAALPAKTAPAR